MTVGSEVTSTVSLVQNPAFGALLLWQFGRSYQQEKPTDLPVLNLHFLVLPMLLHARTLEKIKSTNPSSGLAQVANKLAAEREQLFSIHGRALVFRSLTLESVGTGIASQLLHLDYDTGKMRSNEARAPRTPERLRYHVRGAEKLGKWFARLGPDHVYSLLRVEP